MITLFLLLTLCSAIYVISLFEYGENFHFKDYKKDDLDDLAEKFIADQKPKLKKQKKRKKPAPKKPVIKVIAVTRRTDQCVICHTRLKPRIVYCDECHTVSHEECLTELMDGKCPGPGCTRVFLVKASA